MHTLESHRQDTLNALNLLSNAEETMGWSRITIVSDSDGEPWPQKTVELIKAVVFGEEEIESLPFWIEVKGVKIDGHTLGERRLRALLRGDAAIDEEAKSLEVRI